MKKIYIFLSVLILSLSSCKVAVLLNSALDLKTPGESNYLTVYADLNSSNSIRIDLGETFQWRMEKISLNKLLQNDVFADWYYSLKNGSWNPVGLIMPNTNYGLFESGREFYISREDLLVVAWDAPFEKIRINANNGTNEYFDYYFPESHAYNEKVTLNYSDLYNDPSFYIWQSNLGTSLNLDGINITRYPGYLTRDVMTSYHYNLIAEKILTVDKWTGYVNLGWLTQPLFNGFKIYANTSSYDTDYFYFPLGDVYDEISVSWDFLSQNVEFLSWYRSLSKGGYLKIGLSTFQTSSYGFISEYNPEWGWVINSHNSLYIIWES